MFKPNLNKVAIKRIVGKLEKSKGSFVYKQVNIIIKAKAKFNVSKISNKAAGSGKIIIPTITTSPMASTISLFFKSSANLALFI